MRIKAKTKYGDIVYILGFTHYETKIKVIVSRCDGSLDYYSITDLTIIDNAFIPKGAE